jgi:hypothetical protein
MLTSKALIRKSANTLGLHADEGVKVSISKVLRRKSGYGRVYPMKCKSVNVKNFETKKCQNLGLQMKVQKCQYQRR